MREESNSPIATTVLFEAAYRQCQRRVHQYVARYERDPDELDDLLQEVWLQAFLRYPSYRGTGSIEGWLLRVARTVCVERTRARGARARVWARYAPTLADDLGAGCLSETEAEERALHRQEACDHATNLLDALPPRERAVATLRIMFGRPVSEVATMLHMAPGTVKAALHHAMAKLRRGAQSAQAS